MTYLTILVGQVLQRSSVAAALVREDKKKACEIEMVQPLQAFGAFRPSMSGHLNSRQKERLVKHTINSFNVTECNFLYEYCHKI